MSALRERIARLYQGDDRTARRFRYGRLAFDIALLVYFVTASFFHQQTWVYVVDALIAVPVAADLAARFLIAPRKGRFLLDVHTWLDAVVLASLLAPVLIENLLFLRVLRAIRILRTYHVMTDVKSANRFVARNQELIESVINLAVFVFVMTALVYALQVRTNPEIANYIDALYFTVTTLTTTGFGDITLEGSAGRGLAIVIMVLGVALFLRLVQAIFRPSKVRFECPDCGLMRHDIDAVHCKHCGRMLHIQDEGIG